MKKPRRTEINIRRAKLTQQKLEQAIIEARDGKLNYKGSFLSYLDKDDLIN